MNIEDIKVGSFYNCIIGNVYVVIRAIRIIENVLWPIIGTILLTNNNDWPKDEIPLTLYEIISEL